MTQPSQVLVEQLTVQIIECGVNDRVFVVCWLSPAAEIAEYLVLCHLPISVSNTQIGSLRQTGLLVKTGLLCCRNFVDLDYHDSLPVDFVHHELRSQRRFHVRGQMRDFFLQPVHITDADNCKITGLSEAKQQHTTTRAVGKRREGFVESCRGATARRLDSDIV